MIEVYTGKLGGGKSYAAVVRIARACVEGRRIYTNVALELDAWMDEDTGERHEGFRSYMRRRFSWELQEGQINLLKREEIEEFYKRVPYGTVAAPVMVVIDEAPQVFDALDKQRLDEELRTWLRHSRKICCDLILITQKVGMLQKRIRDFCDRLWWFTNMGSWRVPVFGIKCPPPWNKYIVQQVFDMLYLKEHCGKWWVLRDDAVFGAYRTRSLHGEEVIHAAEPVRVDFRGSGKVAKVKGDEMKTWERGLVFATMVLSVVGLFSVRALSRDMKALKLARGAMMVVTNSVAAPRVVEEKKDKGDEILPRREMERRVEFRPFQAVMGAGESKAIYIEGREYKVGSLVPLGMVVAVSDKMVTLKNQDGGHVVIVDGLGEVDQTDVRLTARRE